MTSKPKLRYDAKPKKQPKAANSEGLKIWLGFIGVLIGAILTFWGIRIQVYGPIHAAQTAQALSSMQAPAGINSIDTPTPTNTIVLEDTPKPTDTITSFPEPNLNIIAPTKDDLYLVPTIIINYLASAYPDTSNYKAKVSSKGTYIWTYRWCAKYSGTLDENINLMKFSFFIDDIQIPETKFFIFKKPSTTDGSPCQRWATMLSGWDNKHFPKLSIIYYIPSPLSDGFFTYPIGEYRHDVIINFID